MNKPTSVINIRQTGTKKKVHITSHTKPVIPNNITEKWQELIDVAAEIVNVPSALIMRLKPETIEVFLCSDTDGNPYEQGEEAKLVFGLYCETVIGTQQQLVVADACESNLWCENNPDVEIDMISYIGLPINWPDNEVFGTVCLLDKKRNAYNETFASFLQHIKLHIERDLEYLINQKQLEHHNQELEQLNSMKTRFLSLISHDVKGSIDSINQYFDILIKEYESFGKNELLNTLKLLKDSINSSQITLTELLNWSKNDLLELHVSKNKVDVKELLTKLIHFFHLKLQSKNINLQFVFPDNKVAINADEKMMETALRNIISNAIHFSEQNGTIEILLSENAGKTLVKIKDNGIGMSPEKLDKLFSYSGSSRKGGSGIGLLLSKDLLEKNNATVTVNSNLGEGSEFIISI